MKRNTVYSTIKSKVVDACIHRGAARSSIPLDIVERTLIVLVDKYHKSHDQIADEFKVPVRWVRILYGEAASLLKPGKAEDPLYWENIAQIVAADGIEKYPDLGVPPPLLTSWIRMVRGSQQESEQEVEEDGKKRSPRFDADLYLTAALAQGQPEAWAYWRDQFELPLIRWLTRLAGGVRLGEEVVGELAGDLFAGKLKQYKGESALRTWLTVIARNRLTDRLRGEGRHGISLSLWEQGEPVIDTEADTADDLCDRLDTDNQLSRVIEELVKLPAPERALVGKYFFKGETMRVLGAEHGVNRTQIGRRLNGIYTKVRSEIERNRPAGKKLRSG